MNKNLLMPIIVVVIGITWMLNVLNIIPQIDWAWSIGLLAAGVLSIATNGFNKITVITGPFLVAASICSVFRQLGHLSIDLEVPLLISVLGVFMCISQMPSIPVPKSTKPEHTDKQ